MDSIHTNSGEYGLEELRRKQELQHLLHLEKDNEALKLENQTLKEENQNLENENKHLNEIIQRLRDIDKHQSGEGTSSMSQPALHANDLNTSLTYQQTIWQQVTLNVAKRVDRLSPQQYELAMLLAHNVNNQRQADKNIQHEIQL